MKKTELERKVIELGKEIEYQRGIIQELRTVIATTPPAAWPNLPDLTLLPQTPPIYPTVQYQTDVTNGQHIQ